MFDWFWNRNMFSFLRDRAGFFLYSSTVTHIPHQEQKKTPFFFEKNWVPEGGGNEMHQQFQFSIWQSATLCVNENKNKNKKKKQYWLSVKTLYLICIQYIQFWPRATVSNVRSKFFFFYFYFLNAFDFLVFEKKKIFCYWRY